MYLVNNILINDLDDSVSGKNYLFIMGSKKIYIFFYFMFSFKYEIFEGHISLKIYQFFFNFFGGMYQLRLNRFWYHNMVREPALDYFVCLAHLTTFKMVFKKVAYLKCLKFTVPHI